MKAQPILTTAAGATQRKAPFWLKASASMASLTMLLAISSYNVVPTLGRAIDGDVAAIGLAAVQISFTVILAVIPFVPGWSADTRTYLTSAFMLGNGWFAYEIAGHRHDGERTAQKHHRAWTTELQTKTGALIKLGPFTPTDDSQVGAAQNAANTADTDKTTAWTSVNTARAKFVECKKGCKKLEQEVQRLEPEAKQKDEDARKSREDLQKLSGWRTLTKTAEPIQARIDSLNEKLAGEQFVSDTSSTSETGRTIEALLIAILIELGNRFGPEAIFKFLFFAAGASLLLSSPAKEGAEEKSEHQAAPVPSIPLPAVPHVAVAEPAPGASGAELAADNPAPLPPQPPRNRAVSKLKLSVVHGGPGATVIPFKKPVRDSEVLRLLSSGKTQREVAERVGISTRTVKRIVASKRGQNLAAS
jgi:predicted DNA-binding protein (UPF0251 family)